MGLASSLSRARTQVYTRFHCQAHLHTGGPEIGMWGLAWPQLVLQGQWEVGG